jgi:predicted Rossmann fold flavoprotein
MNYDVIVVGAGAAGLMCAIEAGRRGRSVLVLEHNDQVGRKILISGGGRCNFTNIYAEPENYFSQNRDFCRSALAAYPPSQFIALVEHHAIPYHEKKLGQLFCDGSSREIVGMLEAECASAGVQIRISCEISSVAQSENFRLETNVGAFESQSLVVATGGLSIPQIGATGFGYGVAKQFGIKRIALRPGLVPLTFSQDEQALFESLNGVAIEATVSCGSSSFTENVLFTRRGLSGPAILQVSNAWHEGEVITVDPFPRVSMSEVLAAGHDQPRELSTLLSDYAPRRFVQAWCAAYALSQPLNRYSNRQLDEIAQRLHAWELLPAGTAGFGKAEVTLGGVDTNGLQSKTMETRRVPGLFFIGEVVDVTGWLGGYNFQWAWASGFAAGQVA